MTLVIDNPDPQVLQALALGVALRAYGQHGLRVNRAYKPKTMMKMAERILGRKFTARDYVRAGDLLKAWAHKRQDELKARAAVARSLLP